MDFQGNYEVIATKIDRYIELFLEAREDKVGLKDAVRDTEFKVVLKDIINLASKEQIPPFILKFTKIETTYQYGPSFVERWRYDKYDNPPPREKQGLILVEVSNSKSARQAFPPEKNIISIEASAVAQKVKYLNSRPQTKTEPVNPAGQVMPANSSQSIPDLQKQGKGKDIIPFLDARETVSQDTDIRPEKAKRNSVFISYSHEDGNWLVRVQSHIKVLEKMGVPVNLWDDTKIKSGEEWKEKIEKALTVAKVAVLLISTDFLSSDFINDVEIPSLLKAAEEDGVTILPLILKPCLYTSHLKLKDIKSINDPLKPLSDLVETEQEKILVKMANYIKERFT